MNPPCQWGKPIEIISESVARHVNSVAGETYEACSLGVIIVHYCERCDCSHVTVINQAAATTERAVVALETALDTLKEDQHHEQDRSIETTGSEEACN